MKTSELQNSEKDIESAVFRVMRQWLDRPIHVRRHHLITALTKVTLEQLQCLDRELKPPRQ